MFQLLFPIPVETSSVWVVCFPITDHVIFSGAIFSGALLFYPFKNYSFTCKRLLENLKARILKSIITWSEMREQTAQAKKVYWRIALQITTFVLDSFFADG